MTRTALAPDMLDDIERGLASVPAHLRAALRRYLVDHVRPGAFLQALIRNDLAQAVLRADEVSLAYLIELVRFLHNCAPAQSHGSDAALEAWLAEEGVS